MKCKQRGLTLSRCRVNNIPNEVLIVEKIFRTTFQGEQDMLQGSSAM